ncbi:MAG TPA: GDSL-type esterase/lipase family protein [Anaeromyxobacteraceae bacterium]|nr:GDSL-type esterase/lipase family protein [Anaeromyxobacteraceae bacterium]
MSRARWIAAFGGALVTFAGVAALPALEAALPAFAAAKARAAPPGPFGPLLLPAPLVSRGKRVVTSGSDGAALVDGVYRTGPKWGGGRPSPDRPAWAAIEIGRGPTRLLLSWTSSGNHDYWDQFYGAPVDYRIEVSGDSTNGRDGTWRTVVDVKDNPAHGRAHSFPFDGMRWVRMSVTRLPEKVNFWGLFLDEIDVHDLSDGGNDVWAFLGDSITCETADRGTPRRPAFQDQIAARHPGYRPATINVGLARYKTFEALAKIDQLLALNPDAHVWAILIGANDGTPEMVRDSLGPLIDRIKAAGRIPVVARIMFQTKYGPDYAAGKNVMLDAVVRAKGLAPGPDLYGWFKAHPERLRDGLHPDDAGTIEVNRMWAEAVAPLYPW